MSVFTGRLKEGRGGGNHLLPGRKATTQRALKGESGVQWDPIYVWRVCVCICSPCVRCEGGVAVKVVEEKQEVADDGVNSKISVLNFFL